MKRGKLSYRRKLHFAWQFLRRSPAYIDLYREFQDLQDEIDLLDIKRIFPIEKRNRLIREISADRRQYWILFLGLFDIKMPPLNPKIEEPNTHELSRLFDRIKCVEKNIFAPDPKDKRLHVSVNPFLGNEAVVSAAMNELRKHRQEFGIQPVYHRPSEKELNLYLRIYDQHRSYIKDGKFTSWDENNFGVNLYWSKFSRDLSFEGFDVDPEVLRRTAFKTAIKKVYNAPLSILI